MASTRICSIPGCGKGGKIRRGWCCAHYEKNRKYGDPLADNSPKRKPCAQEGCDRLSDTKGLCQTHYSRLVRSAPILGVCKEVGCEKPAENSRGWCGLHYQRWKRHGDPLAGRVLNGEQEQYLLAHMGDDCPKWPYYRNSNGYGEMTYHNRRGSGVHRIVCELVNGPPPDGYEASHNCGKGHEGCFGARCLEWKSHKDNMRDAQIHGTWVHGETHPFAKLTEVQVVEIRRLKRPRRKRGYTASIAAHFEVSEGAIRDIWAGKTWAWMERGLQRV